MSESKAMLWRYVRAAAGVGLPMGALSALVSYALRESFIAERAVHAMGVHYRGGPSVLLLLAWGVGGYVAGAVANRHLGIAGLPGIGFVAAAAGSALLADFALYLLIAGSVPDLLCAIKAVCGVVWVVPGVVRVYLD